MNKLLSLIFSLILIGSEVSAKPYFESLHQQLKMEKEDTSKVNTLCAHWRNIMHTPIQTAIYIT